MALHWDRFCLEVIVRSSSGRIHPVEDLARNRFRQAFAESFFKNDAGRCGEIRGLLIAGTIP